MVFQNSDRSHQTEQKIRDLEKSVKKGSAKGRSHFNSKNLQKEINTELRKSPVTSEE